MSIYCFSYSSCWHFALSISNDDGKKFSSEQKNGIISLCQASPEVFWKKFDSLILTKKKYKEICSSLFKYIHLDCPIPYLINKVYFNNLLFAVKEGVFIPQVDTEFMLQIIFQLTNIHLKKKRLKVLDLGTGCGNIAISLANYRPEWEITASDINLHALRIAKKNAIFHQVRVNFIRSNLFSKLRIRENSFDLIISNPPYVSLEEYKELPEIVKKQPKNALIASKRGLFFYFKILQKFCSIFFKGFFVLEISPFIENKIIILLKTPPFNIYRFKLFSDYSGNARVIVIWKYENKVLRLNI